MTREFTLIVNGKQHLVWPAPDTPLLYVLRNHLKLRGPRFGCGMAQCGACAVLVDGKEVRSCGAIVSSIACKHVTTVEGLPVAWATEKGLSEADAAKTLHPVQQAWIDEQVPQCGYCQSGMMIAAVQLLSKNPNPTVAQIKDAFTNTPRHPIFAGAEPIRQSSMRFSVLRGPSPNDHRIEARIRQSGRRAFCIRLFPRWTCQWTGRGLDLSRPKRTSIVA